MTEMLVLHGDSLSGGDAQKEARLERIREALREREIDFVDQPEALEIWIGADARDVVLEILQGMGYRTDLYRVVSGVTE